MESKRGQFSGKLGFIMAAAGSAVGLGNIWRFPYYAAKYGGGIFLLVYILLVVTFGFTLMTTEIALGRRTGQSPINAYKVVNKKSSFIGVVAVIVSALITPYYAVISGWVIKYLSVFATGGMAETVQDGYFGSFISSSFEPIVWLGIIVVISTAILLGGVQKGIEKASKILMPMLVILTVLLVIYSLTLPGALEGFKYVLIPDFSRFSIMGVIAAMAQMFFSMSLGMAIMITYGSYMKKEEDIESCVNQIGIFDTAMGILAALMVVPAVFAFSGGDPNALNAGPGLMFVTMPKVFASMPMGNVVGVIFFILVFFAALTSIISLMEGGLSTLCDNLKISRKTAALVVGLYCFVVGIAPSLGFGVWESFTILGLQILDFMDFISNYILMPLGAFATCILIAYIVKPEYIIDEVSLSGKFKKKKLYLFVLKYVAPIFTLAIMVAQILDTFKVIKL